MPILRPDRRAQRATRCGGAVELAEVADRVQLQQVDMVGLQPLQGSLDLAPGRLAVTLAGLGGQEDPVPDVRHPRTEPQLRVAVPGRDVDVVDAAVEGFLDRAVGHVLGDVTERRGAVDEHRAPVLESSEPARLHDATLCPIGAVGNRLPALPPGNCAGGVGQPAASRSSQSSRASTPRSAWSVK
jgi:hypothetical protein